MQRKGQARRTSISGSIFADALNPSQGCDPMVIPGRAV